VHLPNQHKLQRRSEMRRPFQVAVTGSAATGKSLVCRHFKNLGVPVIELDVLARKAVSPPGRTYRKIIEAFGKEILNRDGTLDRKALRRKVLADERARRTLERIVHPAVRKLLEEAVGRFNGEETPFVMVEVPLLFETGMAAAFDSVVLVMAQTRLQVKRLSARDRVPENEAERLIRTQIPDAQKIDRSDFVIFNTGSVRKLHSLADQIFWTLNGKYPKKTTKLLDRPESIG